MGKINFLRISTGENIQMTKAQHDKAVELANKRRGRGKALTEAKKERFKQEKEFKEKMKKLKEAYKKDPKKARPTLKQIKFICNKRKENRPTKKRHKVKKKNQAKSASGSAAGSVKSAKVSGKAEAAVPFKTYDNDTIMGKAAPVEHIRKAPYIQGNPPKEGSNLLVLLWRKSYKSGYKFMPLYTALHEKFKDQNLEVIGICVDRDKNAAEGFLKKYTDGPKGNFTPSFPICEEWSPANKLYPLKARPIEKGFLDNMMDLHPGMKEMPSIPHSFLINSNGTIVWHQDHSERGQAAPDHMDEVEEQCKRLLSGSMLMSLGSKVIASSSSSESDSDTDDEGGAAADMGDFFTSL